MSSILDAVTRDGSRSGSIPGAASPAPAPPPGDRGRWKPAVLVVVVGVLAGAAAARLFGGGEPPVEDLRTERTVAAPTASAAARPDPGAVPKVQPDSSPGVPPNAEPKAAAAHGKAARAGAKQKDETEGAPAPAVVALPSVAPPAVPAAPTAVAPGPAAAPAPVAAGGTPAPKPPVEEPVTPALAQREAPLVAGDAGVDEDDVSTEVPTGAPPVTILFVAWSRTPGERLASMRVGTGSLSVVHEGEYVEGLQVAAIHPESVDFRWTGQKFRVPVREF